MKKISAMLLLFAVLCTMVSGVSAYSYIGVPYNTVIPPGSSDNIPVYVDGLDAAQGVAFNLTFNSSLLSVNSVSRNSAFPNASVYYNIDNVTGLVSVAVTDADGISVSGQTPLVYVTFAAADTKGTSSIGFPEVPTYSKNFLNYTFESFNTGTVEIRDKRTIIAPSSASLGTGQSLPLKVANISGAKYINIEFMYNGNYVSIEDIVPASGVIVSSAGATNGKGEMQPYSLTSEELKISEIPEDLLVRAESEGYNWAWMTLMIPAGLTGDEQSVVDILFKPTETAGTANVTFHYCYYRDTIDYGEYIYFDESVPGQIVTSGGGETPGGDAMASSGKIVVGKSGTFPVMIKGSTGSDGYYLNTQWNSLDLTLQSVKLNGTAETSGATIDWKYNGSYSGEPAYCNVRIGNLSGFNSDSWASLLDFTFSANRTTECDTWFNLSYAEEFVIPRGNVTIYNPAKSIENGVISISEGEPLPDFIPDVDAPHIVKINRDDMIHVKDLYMYVSNVGKADFNSGVNVPVKAELGDYSSDTSFNKEIKVGETKEVLHVNIDMSSKDYGIDPENTTLPQDKVIKVTVNPEPHVVEEKNYLNNSINHSIRITAPDLSAEIIAPSKTTQFVNTSIGVNVTNKGEVASVETTLLYEITGKAVETIQIPGLEPNASVMVWRNASSMLPGAYLVQANINPDHLTDYETTYENNRVNKTITSYAEPDVTVVIPKDAVYIPGSEVNIPVIVNNASELAAFQMTFSYNSGAVDVKDVLAGEIGGFTKNLLNGSAIFNGAQISGLTGNIEVATIVINVTGDSGDETPLTLAAELWDINGFEVPVTVTSGNALLMLYGDANDDGKVNQADTLQVLKWVVGIETGPVPETTRFIQSDVTKNNYIDVGDAMFIAQHNVGLRDEYFNIK